MIVFEDFVMDVLADVVMAYKIFVFCQGIACTQDVENKERDRERERYREREKEREINRVQEREMEIQKNGKTKKGNMNIMNNQYRI